MSSNMKLAIITAGFKPVPAIKGGAVEQLITDMIFANEKKYNYNIDLYTLYDKKLATYNFKHTHIIELRDPQSAFLTKALHYIYRKLSHSPRRINYMSRKIANNFKRDYYDVVLIENNMDTYNYLYNIKSKEKFYFHLHNDFDNGDKEKTKANTLKIINTADGILVVSNYLKKKLQRYGATRIKVVPNFVDDNLFPKLSKAGNQSIRKKYGIAPKDVIFTYIGRLDKAKGADKLLEALSCLQDVKNIKCLIVGNNFFNSKEERGFNRQLEKELQKQKKKVIFTGYIDNTDLYKIYSVSDCIVIPSQVEEAFGLVALEAMRMKKPVIASDAGALPEVLSPKGSVIIKRDDNYVQNLAKAIKALSNDEIKRERMGEANLKASQKYPHNKEEYYSMIVRAINIEGQ